MLQDLSDLLPTESISKVKGWEFMNHIVHFPLGIAMLTPPQTERSVIQRSQSSVVMRHLFCLLLSDT